MRIFGRKNRDKGERGDAREAKNQKLQNQEGEQKAQMQEAVLTLYACRKGVDIVPEEAKEVFSEEMERAFFPDEDEFAIRLKDGTGIRFHMVADPEETQIQAQGMAQFFARAPLEDDKVKEAALCQIRLFNCIIGISFAVDENEKRTRFIVGGIYEIAKRLSAFVLYPNMYLFHSDGRLLISIDGKSDFSEYYPEASSTLLEREAKEQEADRERKRRSVAVLKERNIPYTEHLNCAVFEEECCVPDKAEIIRRLACVFAACVKAEVYTCGQFKECGKEAAGQLAELEERYQVFGYLSPEEKEYMGQEKPEAASHNKFGWRYECCAVFLWALSMVEMKEPTEICDAAELGEVMWNHTFESLMEKSVLRSKEEILDMQDLVFRYHWACVDARIHRKELEGLNGDIIYEWHYALNWLVGADGITEWDEVVTNT